MSLAKLPSADQVAAFIAETPRQSGESQRGYVCRLLRAVVLANTQAKVAERMGIQAVGVANTFTTDKVGLDKVCRVAEAVDCEIILRPRRPAPGAAAPASEGST